VGLGAAGSTRRRSSASWVRRERRYWFRPYAGRTFLSALRSSICFRSSRCPPLQRSTRGRPVLIQRIRFAPFAPNVYCRLSWGFVPLQRLPVSGSVRTSMRDPILTAVRAGIPSPAVCVFGVLTSLTLSSARDLALQVVLQSTVLGIPCLLAACRRDEPKLARPHVAVSRRNAKTTARSFGRLTSTATSRASAVRPRIPNGDRISFGNHRSALPADLTLTQPSFLSPACTGLGSRHCPCSRRVGRSSSPGYIPLSRDRRGNLPPPTRFARNPRRAPRDQLRINPCVPARARHVATPSCASKY